MSQDNQFQQYGYDHYLKAPKKNRIEQGGGFMEGITEKLRSPIMATVALLATGAIFTGVIIMAYPSGDQKPEEIPIVKADLSPMKSEPVEPGGMEVPYQDSTVLSSIGEKQPLEEGQRIENLLAQSNEDLTSKEEALQQAMAENLETNPDGEMIIASAESEEHVPQERGMFGEEAATALSEEVATPSADSLTPAPAADAIKEPEVPQIGVETPAEASNLLQKIEPDQATEISADSSEKIASTASAAKPKMHAAATSPETMDYVRSVLNENSAAVDAAKSAQAQDAAINAEPLQPQAAVEEPAEIEQQQAFNTSEAQPEEIEPAAGAATSAVNIEPGNYYVQLASITDSSRADSEYAKLQKKFSSLSGLQYRVEEAHLDKGTFYRIQAGPVSKASANAVCDAIKASKPGGCIVVK